MRKAKFIGGWSSKVARPFDEEEDDTESEIHIHHGFWKVCMRPMGIGIAREGPSSDNGGKACEL